MRRDAFIKQSLDYLTDKNILEIGCGTGGDFTAPMARLARRLVCIDISGESVNVLNKKFEKQGFANAKAIKMDACTTQFPDQSFDGVVGIGVLHHFEDLEIIGGETKRILKPNGIGVFSDPLDENPALRSLRWVFSKWMTNQEWEHPFTVKEAERFCELFQRSEMEFYEVFSPLSVFFTFLFPNIRLFSLSNRLLDKLDVTVLRHFSQIKYLACMINIKVEK
jgi:ubiquinone/menaquinone biosynthesis C-methylase UbiE